MTTRVQSQRFSTTNTKPSTTTRPSGEFWLNFPDLRLGMIDLTQSAVDLLAVRNYTPTATYALGDYAVYSGELQRAKAAISPHAYDATEWDPLVTKSYTDGAFTTRTQNDARYVLLAGSTMVGFLNLVGDPVAPLNAATKQYTDAQVTTRLPYSGGTLTGPLILSGPPTSANMAATKGYIDTLVGNYLPLTGGVLSGTLRVANGRLISSNAANNPSVSVWDTNQNYAAGMFLGGSNRLYFGRMDSAGNFASTWAYFSSDGNFWATSAVTAGYMHSTGNLDVDGSVYTGGNVNTNAVTSRTGLFQIAPNYYMQRSSSDGAWRFVENGTINGTIDTGGNYSARGGLYGGYVSSSGNINAGGTFTGGAVSVSGQVTGNTLWANDRVYARNDSNFWLGDDGTGWRMLHWWPNNYSWKFSENDASLIYDAEGWFWAMRSDGVCFNARSYVAGYGPYWDLSDERAKEAVKHYDDGLAVVRQIQPIRFRRIPGKRIHEDHALNLLDGELGFSAQSLRSVLPEAVMTLGIELPDGSGGLDSGSPSLGVANTPILVCAINAIKQLDARLTALEGK